MPPLLGAKAPRSNPFNAGGHAPCGGRLLRGFPTWAPLTGRALSVRPSAGTPPASAPVLVWRLLPLGGIYDIAPVEVAALERVDERLSGRDVGRNGDIVHVAQAQKPRLVGLAGLRADRVAEKEQQVDLVAGDARRDLLVAALRPAQEAGYLQPGRLGDELAGRTGRAAMQNWTISSFLESCAINAMFIGVPPSPSSVYFSLLCKRAALLSLCMAGRNPNSDSLNHQDTLYHLLDQ